MQCLRAPLAKKERSEKGFSFIELVITVAVTGILTSIAIPAYGAIQSNAKQAAVEANAQTGYRLVAASLAGFSVDAAPTTVGKPKTPQALLDSLVTDAIGLAFLDKSGAVATAPAEDFCVYAYNKQERFGDKYRYSALVGACPAVAPDAPAPGTPTTPETPGGEATPDPAPEPSAPPEEDEEETVAAPLVLEADLPAATPRARYSTSGQSTNIGIGRGVALHGNLTYTISTIGTTDHIISSTRWSQVANTRATDVRIIDLATDAAGNLYFSTSEKKVYKNSRDNPLAIDLEADNLLLTKDGSLLFTSTEGKIHRYDQVTRQTSLIATSPVKTINDLTIGRDTLYLATNGDGVYAWKVGEASPTKIVSTHLASLIYANDGNIYGISQASSSTMIMKIDLTTARASGLYRVTPGGYSFGSTDMTMHSSGTIYLRGGTSIGYVS